MLQLLADVAPGVPDASIWSALASQVPALLLFVATMWFVFKYLERKDERDRAHQKTVVDGWISAQQAQANAFLNAMREGQERNREERATRDRAAQEIAKDCHAVQGQAVASMQEMARAAERLTLAVATMEKTAERMDRFLERCPATAGT